jgi:integrase
VQLLLLTGARRDEVAGMRWDEINGDTWTIPEERAKTDQPLDASPIS